MKSLLPHPSFVEDAYTSPHSERLEMANIGLKAKDRAPNPVPYFHPHFFRLAHSLLHKKAQTEIIFRNVISIGYYFLDKYNILNRINMG